MKRKNSGSDDEELELKDQDCISFPDWAHLVENAKVNCEKVVSKINEIEGLHRKLLRPDFVEQNDNQNKIDSLGEEISKLISIAHKNILNIRSYQSHSRMERKLISNCTLALIVLLQNQTASFRNEQNSYLKQINSLEEYTNEFFDSLNFSNDCINEQTRTEQTNSTVETFDNFLKPTSSTFNQSHLDDLHNDERLDEYFQIKPNQVGQKQLLQFEIENTKLMQRREKEVMGIVKSIMDLNLIYKDLSQMVEEQGTIVDRIDYNVESTQTRVYEGYKQLEKAERYQRANRKMYCIFLLSLATLFMIILLIITKF